MTNEKLIAARILDLACQAPEVVDEGFFYVTTNTGKVEEFVLLRDAEGTVLARYDDVDSDTGSLRDGAPTWKIRVEFERA